jgi:peptide alpha-N-acetyltransferase
MLREMTDEFIRHLQEHSKFHPDDTDERDRRPFWALFLQAGLYELAGDYTKSLDLLTQCLEHTPTAVDVYEVEARVLQSRVIWSLPWMPLDKGPSIDQQDRYMNNLTTKFMLQANMPAKAFSAWDCSPTMMPKQVLMIHCLKCNVHGTNWSWPIVWSDKEIMDVP